MTKFKAIVISRNDSNFDLNVPKLVKKSKISPKLVPNCLKIEESSQNRAKVDLKH